jgi:uncharacterized membrane protein YidH (DUF202 family)
VTENISMQPDRTTLSGPRRAERAGKDLAHSPVMAVAARLGLAARGVVYLIIGILAIDIAAGGGSSHQANQGGAFVTVASSPGGAVLLAVLAIGLACYSLWRFSQVFVGTPENGKKMGPRLKSLVRAVIYAALFVIAIKVLLSGSTNQDKKSQDWTARLMHNPGGRWLVGAVGLVILGVGALLAYEGITRKFRRQLDLTRLSPRAEQAVTVLGTIGETSRGVVVSVVGLLVLDAAIAADPHKSRGLDGALQTLAQQSFGSWLLGVLAVGLVAFGCYGFASARYART